MDTTDTADEPDPAALPHPAVPPDLAAQPARFDSPWKDAIKAAFPEFLAFYFPAAHRGIDWSRPHTFLDKELRRFFNDGVTGPRHADLVVSVHRRGVGPECVYIHARNAARQRLEAKRRLVRLLYERRWSKERVVEFFLVLDAMLVLPAQLDDELWQDIVGFEEDRNMRYVSSVERIGIRKGIEKGVARGRVDLLERMLGRRFGAPLPAWVRPRLEAAAADQIDRWAEDIFDATSLEALLGAE